MAASYADIVRGLLRPRFIILAVLTIFTFTTYTRMKESNYRARVKAVYQCPIPDNGRSPAGSLVTIKDRLIRSELQHQRHVAQRGIFLEQSGFGSWGFNVWPTDKDSLNWWGYFPPSFNCPHDLQRVGRYNDGGKWMCGMSVLENLDPSKKCVIYSMGVYDDSSWEAEMMDRTHCEVWAFDGSVEDVAGDAKGNPKMHFSKVFIGNEDRVDAEGSVWKTLPTIMKENGHEWIDVLKADIEGYEYQTLDGLMDAYQGSHLPFSQLQVELHLASGPNMTPDVKGFTKFKRWFERLEKMHMRPFMSELSLVAHLLTPSEGFICSEYSFINIAGNHRLLHA
ncbi:hypothetical protein BGZ59_011803 [Podila verticillata]|nr:hypothetical protein BGZ59_011803 [Podila verticillata]KFH72408.1 hypothetical protein MVEG_02699 [Podila verticillata NRRL 6337]